MRKIFFEENFRRMLCKIFPPSSCVGKGGTKRTTLEMVAKKFFRWLQILPSWGDSNLFLQDETNESRFEQLARLLPSWLDRHCPRKLLPPGAKEPHRKWLELCCLGQKLRDERNSESHWRNPTYNLQRTLMASQKREHQNTWNEKGVWYKKSTTDTLLIILFLPNLADLKGGRIWGKENERTGHTLPCPLPIPVSTISQTWAERRQSL